MKILSKVNLNNNVNFKRVINNSNFELPISGTLKKKLDMALASNEVRYLTLNQIFKFHS